MSIFYERQESATHITIILKLQALFYYAIFLGIGSAGFLSGTSANIVGLMCLTIMFVVFIASWSAKQEIKKHLSEGGSLQKSGSKFSLTRPLTFTLQKK